MERGYQQNFIPSWKLNFIKFLSVLNNKFQPIFQLSGLNFNSQIRNLKISKKLGKPHNKT